MNSDSRSPLPCETGSEYVWTCWLSRLGLQCAHLWTLTVSSSPLLDVQREEHQLAWLWHAAALWHRQVPRRGVCMLPVGWGKWQCRLRWRRGRRFWRLVGWSRHGLHWWRVSWRLSGCQRSERLNHLLLQSLDAVNASFCFTLKRSLLMPVVSAASRKI